MNETVYAGDTETGRLDEQHVLLINREKRRACEAQLISLHLDKPTGDGERKWQIFESFTRLY